MYWTSCVAPSTSQKRCAIKAATIVKAVINSAAKRVRKPSTIAIEPKNSTHAPTTANSPGIGMPRAASARRPIKMNRPPAAAAKRSSMPPISVPLSVPDRPRTSIPPPARAPHLRTNQIVAEPRAACNRTGIAAVRRRPGPGPVARFDAGNVLVYGRRRSRRAEEIMDGITTAGLDSIVAPLNFLVPMSEKPVAYNYQPPPGVPVRTGQSVQHQVPIRHARPLIDRLSLDREGCVLLHHQTAVTNFYDEEQIRTIYYPECERVMKAATGAARVVAFDHIVRNAAISAKDNTIKIP